MTIERGATSPAVRRRPRHAAKGTRWAVLGVSGATTAVLVGYMGASAQDDPQLAAPTDEPTGAPSAVVVTQHPASDPGVTPAGTPIRLQATPSVRRLDRVPSSAPAATTHGSR